MSNVIIGTCHICGFALSQDEIDDHGDKAGYCVSCDQLACDDHMNDEEECDYCD
jgi:hypothetical protein